MDDIKKDLKIIAEALIGTRNARDLHATSLNREHTVEAGLNTIKARWPTIKSDSAMDPIFILSAGWRSGSTFLQRIVASASNVFIWGEPYRHAGIIDSLAGQVKAFTDEWPWDEFFIDHFNEPDLSQQWVANLYPAMEDFLAAHIAFFERTFAQPALKLDARRWGLKEIGLTVDHACYLRWLFPKAKFVFLYRNPYHAYRSYYTFRTFYRTWPDQPVFTPARFGDLWRELTANFVKEYTKVDGLLLRYEELNTPETKRRLEDYLGCTVADPDSLERISYSGGKSGPRWVPKLDYFLLKRKVQPIASDLGYRLS
jgi:hypothetical protein